MRKLKKWLIASGLFTLVLTLSGCVKTDKLGKPTGEGWVYNLLVKPLGHFIHYLVTVFDGNYGFAVIALTLIVRLLILPLGLHQSKKANYQSEKIQYLKPQMEAIQKHQQAAVTQEEQLAASMKLKELYTEYDISMVGGMGCLPLLIQMPIFTALFFTIKYAEGINQATFFGVSLGKPSILFTVLAGVAYIIQSLISLIGVPPEQKKQMQAMLLMNPLMIIFISWRSPAGVTLYWVIGGLVSCIQTLITNLYQKPRIHQKVMEEFRLNPPKPIEPPKKRKVAEPVTAPGNDQSSTINNGAQPKAGRNAGKQQRRNK